MMDIEDVKRGQFVIFSRRAISKVAPGGSAGFGEQIIGQVIAILRSPHKGKVRVRFQNQFKIGKHGRGLVEEIPMSPADLTPATNDRVKAAIEERPNA